MFLTKRKKKVSGPIVPVGNKATRVIPPGASTHQTIGEWGGGGVMVQLKLLTTLFLSGGPEQKR